MSKQMLPFHDHPLVTTQIQNSYCFLCERNGGMEIVHHCRELRCNFTVHKKCIERFQKHQFLCNHFLKISRVGGFSHPECFFCRGYVSVFFLHCSICNIDVCKNCLYQAPPLTLFQPKHHKHSFTLLVRLVTFTCNACGVKDGRNPYVCLECNLMLHQKCVNLPRVIIINRHEHRISHTFHLGEGDWQCGVCRKTIDWVYGAFTCSRCPSYAVHSECATRKEVWDGIELEDVPEEEEEIEDPFKVINETDIIHFSHEVHILRLDENYVTDNDNMRCDACVLPINEGPCYKCVECDFSLHKACANFPRKKTILQHNHKLTLQVDKVPKSTVECRGCGHQSNGFRYVCTHENCIGYIIYDVRCSSISEPFHHYLHPHPLYWTLQRGNECHACGKDDEDLLSCIVCKYFLCEQCATLPRRVKHRCDDHFLSLCHDNGNSSGALWCDICETKTNPSERYYTCDECGVSLHTECVLGDLYYMKLGDEHIEDPGPEKFGRSTKLFGAEVLGTEVLANNGNTRPLCNSCGFRCKFPFLLRQTTREGVSYFCCQLYCY